MEGAIAEEQNLRPLHSVSRRRPNRKQPLLALIRLVTEDPHCDMGVFGIFQQLYALGILKGNCFPGKVSEQPL